MIQCVVDSGPSRASEELAAYGKLHKFKNDQEHLRFFLNSLGSYFQGGTSADASSFAKLGVLKKGFLQNCHSRPEFEKPFNSYLCNMQYRDIFHTKLPRVLRSCDRASMAFGKELRVPLLDYRLVEFCMSMPIYQKLRNGEQRFFIRNAFKGRLPKNIVNVPKRAVANPQREWFKDELKDWIYSILSSKSFKSRPYFDQKKVLEEYGRYCGNKFNQNSYHVWQWINVEIWLRTFFD